MHHRLLPACQLKHSVHVFERHLCIHAFLLNLVTAVVFVEHGCVQPADFEKRVGGVLLPCPSTCRCAWRTHHRHWRPHFYSALLHTVKCVVSCSHPPGDHQSLIDIRLGSPQARTCRKISPLFGAPPPPSAPFLIVGSARHRNPA